MANPVLIILAHGSYPWFNANMQGMPEGEPFIARIVDDNGTAIEVMYIGAADKVNKLIGGGVQIYEGDLTQIVAPRGTQILDVNDNVWTSTGTGWKQQNATGPVNIDCGSFW